MTFEVKVIQGRGLTDLMELLEELADTYCTNPKHKHDNETPDDTADRHRSEVAKIKRLARMADHNHDEDCPGHKVFGPDACPGTRLVKELANGTWHHEKGMGMALAMLNQYLPKDEDKPRYKTMGETE